MASQRSIDRYARYEKAHDLHVVRLDIHGLIDDRRPYHNSVIIGEREVARYRQRLLDAQGVRRILYIRSTPLEAFLRDGIVEHDWCTVPEDIYVAEGFEPPYIPYPGD